MIISEFLSRLNDLDVRLWIENDHLRCNAPKGVLTQELRDELATRKEEIISFLKTFGTTQPDDESSARTDIVRVTNRIDPPPLSFSQQRLWFLDQFDPGSTAYSIPVVFKFEGEFQQDVLEKSINTIVRRHESLRTTFSVNSDNLPLQIIHPFSPVTLQVKDLMGLPQNEKEPAVFRLAREQSSIPFDLKKGPLFRTLLIRTAPQTHYLFINMHHTISDGWSTGVFTTELAALMEAFSTGKENPLPDLPVQYSDYAIWQRRSQGSESLRPQLEYWINKLSGRLPVLELPTNRPRPAFQTYKGETIQTFLPSNLTLRIKDICKQHQVTLFMVLLAAYNVLLHRYTGQEDLLVGTPIANRDQKNIEGLIGFFVNTIVIRNELSGNLRFIDFLDRVRQSSLEAFTNHELPFEHIVEALHPARDTSHSPIIQVMFILQNTPFRSIHFHNLEMRPFIIDSGASKYDLTLTVWESPDGTGCFFEYNTDLFDKSTIERMAGHYQVILESICDNIEMPVAQLQMLTAQEQTQILHQWNNTYRALPSEQTLQSLFEAQVQNTPDSVAVFFEQEQITYRQLDQRANQLAQYLRKLGIGPEALVGVNLNRSIDMVVALLGILKAGGAYVPLDPYFPADRLAYMLEDSGAKVLLTQESLAGKLGGEGVQMVCIDTDWPVITRESTEPLETSSTQENLAYVIYTSGSTGRPKGVQVLQRGVVNFLLSMQREPGITPEDVLLSVTTLSFDIFGLELYLPLISGAQLVLVSSAVAADGSRLAEALSTQNVTIMQATPTTWRLLIAAGWMGNARFKVLCGGEAFPPDLVAALLERSGSLWNMYGPTETTIWSTICQITTADEMVTIGRPIQNTSVYLLDAYGQPVPVGIPGELYIGGEGVARGYLNRPELTAERFLANPFSQPAQGIDWNTRFYRTGDLCRYLSDGRIEYLGRMDNQVKLRGFRIELGEIEANLSLHPTIDQAVVIAREDTPGDKRLIAYLTPKGIPPSTTELRDYLHDKLPDYMIPSVFMVLQSLPLTPNGKVDRRALPVPEIGRPDLATQFTAPSNEIERTLAGIWQAALKLDQVGIHDNFFELGGHSLLIVQVHHQVCQHFQTDLTIAQMFQYPTIQALAQYLNKPQQHAVQPARQDARERALLQKEAINRQRRFTKPEGNNG